MLWNGIINLEDYVIAAAPYGGPIGKEITWMKKN